MFKKNHFLTMFGPVIMIKLLLLEAYCIIENKYKSIQHTSNGITITREMLFYIPHLSIVLPSQYY